jgi:acyl carrier protein
MPTVEDRIRQIIADQLGVESADIDPVSTFADLGADSLDQTELVLALEDTFDMEIPDADAEKMTTVQDVIDYVLKNAKSVKQ